MLSMTVCEGKRHSLYLPVHYQSITTVSIVADVHGAIVALVAVV